MGLVAKSQSRDNIVSASFSGNNALFPASIFLPFIMQILNSFNMGVSLALY